MLEEIDVECPYCGETFTALVDASEGDSRYIQDCEVCCSPITFAVTVDPETGAATVDTERDDL
ncbi:MAG: CPXCG motif-containing cysteine-rich protein [Halofilum sp. (in: g-proteobacteria)]